MRRIGLLCLGFASAAALPGCIEHVFFIDADPESVVRPGAVVGRVCDPSGRTWLADATVYTHLFDDDGLLYDSRIAFTDRDGYWQFEGLPGDREYKFYVQYGDTMIETVEVWVSAGDTLRLHEPACFDPLTIDVAVVTGDYDDFRAVLSNLGFENTRTIDGLDEDELADFLLDVNNLRPYDIIFFDGGHIEDGIFYVTEDPTTGEMPDSTVPDTVLANLQEYVAEGGTVYASDWAYDDVELAWPDRLDFVGDDRVPDAAQIGEYGLLNAAVSDAALASFLGTDYLEIEYDLPVWAPIVSASDSVSVHLRGSIEYRVGGNVYDLASVPLLVSFSSGEGRVVYSTFRVAKNADTEIVRTLQYLLYSL